MTLPRWLTPSVLAQLVALDAQYEHGKLTGHYEVRPHYQAGEPKFLDIDAQSVRISLTSE